MKQVDIVIPVYRPTQKLIRLIDMLQRQTVSINRIILINTHREFWDSFVKEFGCNLDEHIVVKHISKQEFNHGKTRNYGTAFSDAPFFILMTDDAVPADEKLVEKLLRPFADENIAMTYARQLPDAGCSIIESYTRSFNYPEDAVVKGKKELSSMGIKAFFASNVCAAYRRKVFDDLGGFADHTIFNEDMIYARKLIDAGYRIGYEPEAKVIHSHNYNGIQQFRRNFDLGVSHVMYPEVFGGLPAESEGIQMVKKTAGYLCSIGKPWLVIKLIWQSGCKYLGYLSGKRYEKLPVKIVVMFSMNKEFWLVKLK